MYLGPPPHWIETFYILFLFHREIYIFLYFVRTRMLLCVFDMLFQSFTLKVREEGTFLATYCAIFSMYVGT